MAVHVQPAVVFLCTQSFIFWREYAVPVRNFYVIYECIRVLVVWKHDLMYSMSSLQANAAIYISCSVMNVLEWSAYSSFSREVNLYTTHCTDNVTTVVPWPGMISRLQWYSLCVKSLMPGFTELAKLRTRTGFPIWQWNGILWLANQNFLEIHP